MRFFRIKYWHLSITLFIVFLVCDSSSQTTAGAISELETILQRAEQVKHRTSRQLVGNDESTDHKCGFGLSFDVARNWNAFNASQKERLRILLSPNAFQCDTAIGHFQIFFDTAGYNQPALIDANGNRIPNSARAFVDSVGKYFNSVWTYFADSLGFDTVLYQSGNTHYRIDIEELGYLEYGATVFQDQDRVGFFSPPRYTSYIRIDNDFKDFYTKGIPALKVTAAHEFHHAVQLSGYGYHSEDIFIYEITSTWMEDLLFTEINDYYQYLKTSTGRPKGQFLYPDISFASSSSLVSYSRSVWGKFIEKRYNRDIMRVSWEYIRSERPLPAIDHALNIVGSSFRNAFLEWTVWNSNTGSSGDTIKYYTEGKQYPEIMFHPTIEYLNSPRSVVDSIEALSSSYHPICILESLSDNCNTSKKMLAIISNLNMASAHSQERFMFSYDLSNVAGSGYTSLSNGIFVRLTVNDPMNWATQETSSKIIPEVIVQPNPYVPMGTKPLVFKLPSPVVQSEGTLYIFTISMDRVVSKVSTIISQEFEPIIRWDGIDDQGRSIPSGIYFYAIDIDGKQYTGKFAVVRE